MTATAAAPTSSRPVGPAFSPLEPAKALTEAAELAEAVVRAVAVVRLAPPVAARKLNLLELGAFCESPP